MGSLVQKNAELGGFFGGGDDDDDDDDNDELFLWYG